jgi:hypothetical protein
MRVRAKKIACNVAAMILEDDLEAGLLKKRYATLHDIGGPSLQLIEGGMRDLIQELRDRARPL